jgi:hypothetical protein
MCKQWVLKRDHVRPFVSLSTCFILQQLNDFKLKLKSDVYIKGFLANLVLVCSNSKSRNEVKINKATFIHDMKYSPFSYLPI